MIFLPCFSLCPLELVIMAKSPDVAHRVYKASLVTFLGALGANSIPLMAVSHRPTRLEKFLAYVQIKFEQT